MSDFSSKWLEPSLEENTETPIYPTDKTDRRVVYERKETSVSFVSESVRRVDEKQEAQRIKDIAAQLVKKYSPVHIDLGSSFLINAKERHIEEAVSIYGWGIVTQKGEYYLTSWGNVPLSAFHGLYCKMPGAEKRFKTPAKLPEGYKNLEKRLQAKAWPIPHADLLLEYIGRTKKGDSEAHTARVKRGG